MNELAVDADKVPSCVGVIMDGNRRWAKAHGMSKLEGHRRGVETVRNTVRFARERGIKHLIIYAFSTENWGREPAEVSYLMDLLRDSIQKEMKEMGKEGVRIRVVGQRDRFSPDLRDAMSKAEKETEKNTAITVWMCLSYGGRAEIVAAANAAAENGEVTEETLARNLWTAEMPEPDIIIRTGGEKRLSGFLHWQSIYSELFFTDTLWPDFTKEEFETILADYSSRKRNFGV